MHSTSYVLWTHCISYRCYALMVLMKAQMATLISLRSNHNSEFPVRSFTRRDDHKLYGYCNINPCDPSISVN